MHAEIKTLQKNIDELTIQITELQKKRAFTLSDISKDNEKVHTYQDTYQLPNNLVLIGELKKYYFGVLGV